ncbi:hypothetical protein GWK47_014302 [Chionoecetes opilio]|uniref:Uncharacterized protein n=1 Tax=Chionoecetes opilio TaxID=41210 RepID=A0A8J5CKK5_CHIOP|nr:hypothetical protein GWK47_014302 [Chionoecetes opilio]
MVVMSQLSLGCGCWRACSPSRSRCVLPQLPPGGAGACSRAWLDGPSSVWKCEQLLDVRQDSSFPPRGDERGTCSPTIRVDRAVSEGYTAVPLGDLGHGHQRVLPQPPGWCTWLYRQETLRGGELCGGGPPRGRSIVGGGGDIGLPPRPGDPRVNEAVGG